MPFITFEGVEGCGKSTQLTMLAARLRRDGRTVGVTREPGGTRAGERIREILMDPGHARLDPDAELLLIEAARRQHVREVIAPARADGVFLLCDRFSDSTVAYQGAGRGLDREWIASLDRRARDGVVPDLTLLYDLDPREGLARASRRGGANAPDPFEQSGLEFHERVRSAYLEIASRESERVVLVEVDGDADAVFARTWRIFTERFP